MRSNARLYQKDPTRTATLRSRMAKEIRARFKSLANTIRVSLLVNDAFGIGSFKPFTLLGANAPLREGQLVLMSDPDKLSAFKAWLSGEVDNIILDQDWVSKYTGVAYSRGVAKSKAALKKNSPEALGSLNTFLNTTHQTASRVLGQQAFSNIQGVSRTMEARVNQILGDGLLAGLSLEDIVDEILESVDGIGIAKANLVARTAIPKAHNMAVIKESTLIASQIGSEEVSFRWKTMEDEKVRATHRARNNRIYTEEEALALIGEPNCRCSIIPVLGKG